LRFLPLPLDRNRGCLNPLSVFPEPRGIRLRQPPTPPAFGDSQQSPTALQ
jgi:hypothetical protein